MELSGDAGGMLPWRTYRDYYEFARNHSGCSIVELGTGRGASTIALAAGLKDSGREGFVHAVDQFFQHAPGGPHPASLREYGEATVDMNLTAFRDNLSRFHVKDKVKAQVSRTTDALIDPASDGPFDMLVIDVDGYVDRDLEKYFDYLEHGSLIIIDDYRDSVNSRGVTNLERFSRLGVDKAGEKIDRLSSYERGRLLGKHLLTYRLIERMVKLGLLEPLKNVRGTLFCRKPLGSAAFEAVWTASISRAVEESVVDDFMHLLRGGRTDFPLSMRYWRPHAARIARRFMNRIGRAE